MRREACAIPRTASSASCRGDAARDILASPPALPAGRRLRAHPLDRHSNARADTVLRRNARYDVANISALLQAIRDEHSLSRALVHHETLPSRPAEWAEAPADAMASLAPLFAHRGIDAIFDLPIFKRDRDQ